MKVPYRDKDIGRIKGMVDLRETYQSLIEIQRHPDYNRQIFRYYLVNSIMIMTAL